MQGYRSGGGALKRWLIIVSILLAASIEGNFWLAGELRKERDRADSATAAGNQHTGKVDHGDQLSAHEDALAAMKEAKDKLTREEKRLLAALRQAGKANGRSGKRRHPLGGGSILVPPGASLVEARRLPRSSDLPGIVVLWERGEYGVRGSGLYVWQAAQASPQPTEWRLIFRIEMGAHRDAISTVRLGAPGDEQTYSSEARSINFVQTADATGDGHSDILTLEGGDGSGGCGTWRLIALRGTRIESIFKREGCETEVRIQREMLRVDSAIYPKKCKNIHGCGRRRTWLRWTGTGWAETGSRVIARH